jgi:tetratricopeptide (TPR) repeat protein
MMSESNLRPAISSFEAAIEADPLAAEPWQELALTLTTEWTRQSRMDNEVFNRAISAQQEAIRRNPNSSNPWLILGRMWWRQYESSQDPTEAVKAFQAFGQAVKRYPNQATLQAEYAKTAVAAGQLPEARQAASVALRLDALNRERGHVDKFLPETVKNWSESLIAEEL